ncbi:subtilisin-like protease SBT5.4 isoform X1 [Telopea speciosissima]|uniref:subtilisin-like protease SBT5.4 isoform X1 n=1 Tax=Telopea speciosissima TaxID=54955 RepID=UPI001CC4DE61|nr:subtilisin-like protease SBT5.4 isoform X1 [Telopea speciosissima]
MGGFSRLPLFLLPFLVFSMLQRPTLAVKKSYVVYLGSHSHGPEITQTDMDLAEQSHYEFLADYVGSPEAAKESIIYCYTKHINGFAAILEEEKAAEIAKNPRVISIFPNGALKKHTTRSWDFIGLEKNGVVPPGSIWEKAKFGEDIIIGNFDGGVWPESKSFSDDGYGPIPSRWKGGCADTSPDGVRCNKKLIGAKAFNLGYLAANGETFNTSRDDDDGHGTHTLSTAAGNIVPNANVFGLGNGTAKGGSPRARVASYKVCGKSIKNGGCFDADAMAAFDAAIHDGVDILSLSLGSPPRDYLYDALAIGSFHAVRNGILVVFSAGNEGPGDGTVTNVAPWLLTVAANSMDRQFPAYVKLGNNKQFKGQSLSSVSLPSDGKMYPLVSGDAATAKDASIDDSTLCTVGSLDPSLIKGKIVVCMSGGENTGVEKGAQALSAGAVGIIIVHDDDLIPEPHMLPAAHLSHTDGFVVFEYIKSTKAPIAYISPPTTELGTKPVPRMASFSAQGPNIVTPEILKPDITAPGEVIIAAFTEAVGPADQPYDTRRVAFTSMSGTSMSCPHVAGVAGLLKSLYPQWSPAAIRSAIMTTASTRDNVRKPIMDSSNKKATPFSYGAGHVQPNRAMDPGLVYDLTPIDYLNFLCTIGYNETSIKAFSESELPYKCPNPAVSLLDFNYPSLTVPNLSGSATLTRKVKNVGSSPTTYRAIIRPPSGIFVSVEPQILTFDSLGQEKTFKITLKTKRPGYAQDYVFGELKWFDGGHHVKSQIVVKAAAT